MEFIIEINSEELSTEDIVAKYRDQKNILLAVGGDGMVNRVLNGIAGTDNILGIIPLGSGNDFYRSVEKDLKEYYDNGGIILADRYTTANMVHQAGKIKDEEERTKFIDWLFDLEFGIYNLPVPTKVFFLNMPTETAQELMKNRENKFTHDTKKDIHERDINYLEKSYQNSLYIADKYNWNKINCVESDKLRSIDSIHEEIYKLAVSNKDYKSNAKTLISQEKTMQPIFQYNFKVYYKRLCKVSLFFCAFIKFF